MRRRLKLPVAAGAGLLAAILLAPTGLQTARAQDAAKTATLGTGKAGGKLLTRDELRVCLRQQDDISARRTELERQRASMDAERATLQKEGEVLKAERGAVDRNSDAVDELNVRTKAHGDRVQAWNQRNKEFAESARPSASKRAELERERDELTKVGEALQAEREALTKRIEASVEVYNAKATTRDQRASDWNARNAKLAEAGQTLQEERQAWAAECGDRRYREDDEIAIRKGQ